MSEVAQELRFMLETAGWQIVERYIRERASDHRARLMDCRTWDDVLRHRGAVEALEGVLLHIERRIREEVEEDAEV